MIFALAGTSAFALTIKQGDDTIDLYASIRMHTIFTHVDPGDKAICGRPAGENCYQFAIGMQDNSRAGIRWTRGNFFLNNEWGIGGPSGNQVDDSTTMLRMRFLYGDYKIDGGKGGRIRFGQLPGIVHNSNYYDVKFSNDHALQGFGTLDDVRRVGINYEKGDFSIGLLSMRQDRNSVTGLFNDASRGRSAEFVEIMPRIEAAYSITPDVKVAGTFVTSSARTKTAAEGEENLNDKLYHVNAGHFFLAANPKITENIRLVMSGFYSMNGGLYGMVYTGGGYAKHEGLAQNNYGIMPILKSGADKIEFDNSSAYGGAVALAHSKYEFGFGIQNADNEQWQESQTSWAVYANYKIRISNFRITPEFGYLNAGNERGNPKVEASRGFRAGVQFRIDI